MTDWVVRGLGAFYLAGGLAVLAAMARGRVADAMLEALTGGTRTKHRVRFLLLAAGAILTAASGLAALTLSRWTVTLMLANVAMQGLWLAWAHRHFPPEDEEDALGRRRTINAAVGFLAITVIVLWLRNSGQIRLEGAGWSEAALGALTLGLTIWATIVWRKGDLGPGVPAQELQTEPQGETPVFDPPGSVRLEPAFGCWPLWDQETSRNVDPASIGLPQALVDRIRAFEDATLDATDADHADGPTIVDKAARARLEGEATAICRLLVEIYGEDNVCWRLPGDA